MSDKSVIASLQRQIDAMQSVDAGVSNERAAVHARPRSQGMSHAGGGRRPKGASDKPNGERGASDAEAAFKKIVALVNASDRPECGVRDRLARAGFEATAIEESVARAKNCGFIDDMRYAQVLIRSRIAQGKGSAGIARELASCDIDVDAVLGWPFEYAVSDEDEIDRALSVLKRKPPHSKNQRESAYRRLMQKGYSSSVSSTAARMWAESQVR